MLHRALLVLALLCAPIPARAQNVRSASGMRLLDRTTEPTDVGELIRYSGIGITAGALGALLVELLYAGVAEGQGLCVLFCGDVPPPPTPPPAELTWSLVSVAGTGVLLAVIGWGIEATAREQLEPDE